MLFRSSTQESAGHHLDSAASTHDDLPPTDVDALLANEHVDHDVDEDDSVDILRDNLGRCTPLCRASNPDEYSDSDDEPETGESQRSSDHSEFVPTELSVLRRGKASSQSTLVAKQDDTPAQRAKRGPRNTLDISRKRVILLGVDMMKRLGHGEPPPLKLNAEEYEARCMLTLLSQSMESCQLSHVVPKAISDAEVSAIIRSSPEL